MRRRLAVLAALVTALGVAGGAHACINVHIAPSPDSAQPGETVTFSISGLLAGAEYTVSVNGQTVASGTSSGETASGSFSMPDLGSQPLTTTLGAYYVHDDLEGSQSFTSATLGYEPATPPPRHVSVPQPQPQPEPEPAARPPAPIKAKQPPRVHPSQRRTRVIRSQPATPQTATVEPEPAIAREAAPATVSVPTATAPVAPAKPQAPRAAHVRAPIRTATPGSPDRWAPAPLAVAAPAAHDRRSGWPFSTALLLLLALIPATGIYAWRRRRKMPKPLPPDEIEAELQEIIAEERARALEAQQTPHSD